MNEEHLAKISFLNKIKDDLEQEQGSSLAKIEWWEKKNESLTSSEQRYLPGSERKTIQTRSIELRASLTNWSSRLRRKRAWMGRRKMSLGKSRHTAL